MERGDIVLCVCDFEKFVNHYDHQVNYPMPGRYYTVRKVRNLTGINDIVFLDEIENEKVTTGLYGRTELGFEGSCFVKVPDVDISQLTKLL